ncbi:hypothetical protein EIZ83_25240, partial [Escherichia coli]|nr:hypothetical protein [Escherichia coli]
MIQTPHTHLFLLRDCLAVNRIKRSIKQVSIVVIDRLWWLMVCEKAAESLHHAERNCTQRTDTSLADERGEAFMSGKNH